MLQVHACFCHHIDLAGTGDHQHGTNLSAVLMEACLMVMDSGALSLIHLANLLNTAQSAEQVTVCRGMTNAQARACNRRLTEVS